MDKKEELFNLCKKVSDLQYQLYQAKQELYDFEDGFYYEVTYCRYGFEHHKVFNNSETLIEFLQNSAGGDNYIVTELKSDNPDWQDWHSDDYEPEFESEEL